MTMSTGPTAVAPATVAVRSHGVLIVTVPSGFTFTTGETTPVFVTTIFVAGEIGGAATAVVVGATVLVVVVDVVLDDDVVVVTAA
jgi:hypothetical protein